MSLEEINQLRYDLNSLTESESHNNADIIDQIHNILTQIDSLDLNKELIIQSKIALTISKVVSRTKDDNIKMQGNNLFQKILQIVKTKSPPQSMDTNTQNSEKDKYFRHFFNKLNEIRNERFSKNPENIAKQIAEKLVKCDDPSTKFTFLINLITDNVKEETFHFKRKLLRGHLTVDEFVNLTKKDILTDEDKKKMKIINEENMNKAMVPKPPPISSKMYKCKSCKGNNVSFRQLQMLSADEPMTVLFFCGDCGYTWKK